MKSFKTEVYITDVESLKDRALFDLLYSRVRMERREKIDKIRFDEDKRLSLGVEILLKTVLEKRGIDYGNIEIVYGENKKPYLKGDDFYFNLSHSGKMACCAISNAEIGVDIEQIQRADIKIMKRVFTEKEQERIISSDNKSREFIRLWTLKESYMKYCGKGFGIDPRDIELEFNGNIPYFKGLYFSEYEENGYLISVCSGENSFESAMKSIDLRELYQ